MRYWKRVDAAGITTTVESYSHREDVIGAIEIDEIEFQAFLANLPPSPIPPPPPDWKTLWLAADTVAKKLAVLAKKLDLE